MNWQNFAVAAQRSERANRFLEAWYEPKDAVKFYSTAKVKWVLAVLVLILLFAVGNGL